MKVIQINAVCGHGSTGRMCVELLEALREAGHTGKIFYGVGDAPDDLGEYVRKFGGVSDYYLHNALSRLTDHAGWYSKGHTRRLIRALEEERPDLIHLHNLHGYYLNYPMLFAYLKEKDIPVVWTLHDCWAFTGHCTHFTRVGCRQWQRGCHTCLQLRRYPKCLTAGDVAGNFQRKQDCFTGVKRLTLVTPSQWLAEQVCDSFLKDYPRRVIPNGVDLVRFCPEGEDVRRRYGMEGKKVVLAVANVWNEHKGLTDLLALAEKLDDRHQLVLLGLTREQIKRLPANIFGLPRTGNPEELAMVYRSADVLVNPSREDTYPTVNLEAQACGTTVVCYDLCGCPETILPGMGSVVPGGDVDGLNEHAAYWTSGARPPVPSLDRLDRRTTARRYLDLYKDCLRAGGEGAG